MKIFWSILMIVFFAGNLFSQDLVVTGEGDSLNCKITDLKDKYVHFTFKYKGETRSTLLPISEVKTYRYNYFSTSEVLPNEIVGVELYPHWKLGFNGGWSYETADIADNVPADFKNYVKELKSGYHFSGDATYFFSEQIGLGLKYVMFKTSNHIDNIYVIPVNGAPKYGKMSDDISVSFIGPSLSTRLLSENKLNSFVMNLALGYMGYTDDQVVIDKYKVTGSTFGLAYDFGYDVGISKNVAVGIQISYVTGTLFEYKIDDGTSSKTVKLEKDQYESLSRFDISIGLRFNSTN